MTRIVTVLTEGFADWETALINAAGRSYYGIDTAYASPGGKPVTSAGGLRVTPDLALETLDLDPVDALIVCGGSAWQSPGAPDLAPLLQAARTKGKLIGLICDATVAGARAGLLDEVQAHQQRRRPSRPDRLQGQGALRGHGRGRHRRQDRHRRRHLAGELHGGDHGGARPRRRQSRLLFGPPCPAIRQGRLTVAGRLRDPSSNKW